MYKSILHIYTVYVNGVHINESYVLFAQYSGFQCLDVEHLTICIPYYGKWNNRQIKKCINGFGYASMFDHTYILEAVVFFTA